MDEKLEKVLVAILSKATCNAMTCEECTRYYQKYTDTECPCTCVEQNSMTMLAKSIFEQMNQGRFSNLSELPFDNDWTFEDILDLIEETVK